jgi:hypothetical protein
VDYELGGCFTLSAVELERGDAPPLLAVEMRRGEVLVNAAVVDPLAPLARSGPDTHSVADGLVRTFSPCDYKAGA